MEALSLTRGEWIAHMEACGQPSYRADQVLEWLHKRRASDWRAMSNLPVSLREGLESRFPVHRLSKVGETGAADTTRKFLFRLADASLVETVLIPASPALHGDPSDRLTICISSQVGCAYGCRFCASGLDGWKRNLSAAEIIEQFLQVEGISKSRINNIVFMGMGEPLANYDNLIRAIGILNAPWGVGLGARHMTVSTSGLVPQIRKLATQPLQIRLAISLHGATDEVRNRIMPVNRKYPLAELIAACDDYVAAKKQRITFEYILIRNINDDPEQARLLARLARRTGAKVNLIPYNSVDGLEWERPSIEAQDLFLGTLRASGADATLRREKGHDIAAACGQLRLQMEKSFAQPAVMN